MNDLPYIPPSYPLAPDNSDPMMDRDAGRGDGPCAVMMIGSKCADCDGSGKCLGFKAHDPGGSKKWPLQPGVRGSAGFLGPGDCYRFWLHRTWGDTHYRNGDGVMCQWGKKPCALFIGMNSSTAEGDIDDPTIRAEMDFTRVLGLESYIKTNISPYRATFPKDLSLATVELCPLANLSTIEAFATDATYIIAAWGKLPKPIRRDSDAVLFRLGRLQKPIWCLGKNADGSPKHPLYLKRTTPLERFR